MIHPGLAALEKWDTIEYAAGYRARLATIPDSEIAHHCWRCGWEDADTEALELERHKLVLADGGEDAYAETWGLLFDAGGDARANGVPFDEGRTQPWKEGWIAADINVGPAGFEDLTFKDRSTAGAALPMRTREGPGARWLLLPCCGAI